MKYVIKRIYGDISESIVGESDDFESAVQIANTHCYNEEPTEDERDMETFNWNDYSGYAKVVSDDFDGILYWINGDGDTGSDLEPEDVRYFIIKRY